MATRLKTVHYSLPTLASLTNNTLTNLTTSTLYLPESSKTFRSVIARVSMDDFISATGGSITTKTFGFRLGAAAYTSVANANTITNSGENLSLFWAVDYTSHFNTNWSGTSMTCDFQLQINQSTGTNLGMVNVCVTLEITYEYDDTSSSHVKSVWIPLNAPVSSVPTSATTYDTFPALDTYLPEASKTYRQISVVVQGNEARNGAATDHTMSVVVGSTTVTTGSYEGALATDRWYRYVADFSSIDTSTTHNFQLSMTTARGHHPQCWAVVTYEFDPSTTTRVMNWQMLPMEVASPMGGTTSSDYQRGNRDLWIPEPGTINNTRVAFYAHWTNGGAISGLNMRIGTGSFVAYTDVAAQIAGGNGAMVRNDSAFTLARGRQSLNFDIYRTDTADKGYGISGFWLVNYHSDLATDGVGAHSQTVFWNITTYGTAAAANDVTVSAMAVTIPETSYFISGIGVKWEFMASSGTLPSSVNVLVERLSAEGGQKWDLVYVDPYQTDSEVGVFYAFAQVRDLFKRFPNDLDTDRFDIETSRRWRLDNALATGSGWFNLNYLLTYHSITYDVSGTVSGSGGGTVTLNLCRADTGENVLTTSRTGNGTYSFTWYDDTEDMYVEAYEDATHVGRSDTDVAV